ncbi:MAG: cupin domain-containing protein [Synechococcaceae cyanobacterium]|nr:cupin domain-containing protein [Synechococcaceae cyanobacterium]
MDPIPEALISRHRLEPHPEGGWYRELHRSPLQVSLDGAADSPRSALTAILYLLTDGQRSRWHRLERADEIWHHVAGAPLELLTLPPDGGRLIRQRLGSPLLSDRDEPLAVVPAGWWQAARSLGDWSLLSCDVGPGFEFADFLLMADLPDGRRPPGADPSFV